MALHLKNIFSGLSSKGAKAPSKVVGIDIGSSSVKIVELEQQQEEVLTLKTYGELQLGPYVDKPLGSASVLELPKRIEAVVDVLRESKSTAHVGVLTLPLSSSFITVFSLAAKEKEDISPRVRVEARKYIPVPMSDVTLDWSELPALGEAASSTREILIAAVQNTAYAEANNLLDAIEKGKQPAEIELFSTLRAIGKNDDTSIAIIDLGAQTSKLYIAHEGTIRKIHRVFAGGMQATDRIAKELAIPFEDAENRKRNYTSKDPQTAEIKKAVVTTFERPFQEFKRVITQYELRSSQQVTRIVVTGGGAAFSEMQTYASYMLDRSVERANPFSKIAYPAFMEDMVMDIAPTFSVALGAALRPFQG